MILALNFDVPFFISRKFGLQIWLMNFKNKNTFADTFMSSSVSIFANRFIFTHRNTWKNKSRNENTIWEKLQKRKWNIFLQLCIVAVFFSEIDQKNPCFINEKCTWCMKFSFMLLVSCQKFNIIQGATSAFKEARK